MNSSHILGMIYNKDRASSEFGHDAAPLAWQSANCLRQGDLLKGATGPESSIDPQNATSVMIDLGRQSPHRWAGSVLR